MLSPVVRSTSTLSLSRYAQGGSDVNVQPSGSAVPKAVDVIGGQAQLDYTLGPVSIQPVQ